MDIESRTELRNVLSAAADDGSHAALGGLAGLLHETSALGHDAQTRLEIPDAGHGVGGQLAEGEAKAGS